MEWLVRSANDPSRRFRLLWYFFARSISLTLASIGCTYILRDRPTDAQTTYHVLLVVERNLHIHGLVMLGLFLLILFQEQDYTARTRHVMVAGAAYTFWVACLTLGAAVVFKGSWSTPIWYTSCTIWIGALVIYAPPLGPDGLRWRGTEGGLGA